MSTSQRRVEPGVEDLARHYLNDVGRFGLLSGADEVRLAKRNYGWPEDAQFLVPDGVRKHFDDGIGQRGAKHRQDWQKLMAAYRAEHPKEAGDLEQMLAGKVPAGWDADLPTFAADAKGIASRDSSAKVINAFAPRFPAFVGGSADLAPSTKTRLTFEVARALEGEAPWAAATCISASASTPWARS